MLWIARTPIQNNKNYAPELHIFCVIAVVIKLLSAMQMTRTGRTSVWIKVSSRPGKYEDEFEAGFRPLAIRIAYRDESNRLLFIEILYIGPNFHIFFKNALIFPYTL